MPRAQFVLFDLDGTLSDSAPGILAALRHAFVVNGLAPLAPAVERALLGPPFYESLPPLIGTASLDDVIRAYRSYYSGDGAGLGAGAADRSQAAMYDTALYPGVHDIVAELHAAGVTLAVATSKPEHYAVPIVEYLGMSHFFVTVGGDELDGSLPTKALVIDKVLARLGRPDPSVVAMVGDRSHDVEGARAHDIETLAVGWGYASDGELAAARPRAVCATPDDLRRALRSDRHDRARSPGAQTS